MSAHEPVDRPAPVSAAPTAGAALEGRGIGTGYGSLQVLWGIDLDVAPGETRVVLGANGAGKSTLLRCLAGLLPARSGTIRVFGEDVTGWSPDRRIRAGMSYASETGVVGGLSVRDNLLVGGWGLPAGEVRRRVDEAFEKFPMLAERRRDAAGSLSGGQRKILVLAKALLRRPRLLLMDEPSAGLSPLFVNQMVDTLGVLREERSVAVLLAEQNAKFLRIADSVCVLAGGRRGWVGPVDEFTANVDVNAEFFGLPVERS